MATITRHAHENLSSLVAALITKAAAGEFYDAAKWPRSYYGKRPYSPFPNVDVTSTTTKPTASNAVASSGDTLYAGVPPVQTFGSFLNDVQAAVASGGKFAGKTLDSLILTDHTTKPYFRCNVKFAAGAPITPLAVTVSPAAAQAKTA